MAAGDLLFYPASGSVIDRLISWWTRSPFVHVEIDLGDGTAIGALFDGGISQHPLRDEPGMVRWSYATHTQDADPVDLAQALAWVRGMVGTPYGTSDFTTAAISRAVPFYLTWKRHYDCSALAAAFLVRAGGVNLGPLADDPHLATPGSLARQLVVTPPQGGQQPQAEPPALPPAV